MTNKELENVAVKSSQRTAFRGASVLALVASATLVLTGCAPLLSFFGMDSTPSVEENDTQLSEFKAGDFAGQSPEWRSCGAGMECASVYAPLDWEDPSGERITLALAKQPAKNGDPLGTIFVNPGGPGASGIEYIIESIDYAVSEELQDAYDIVGWDPRGVGQSSAVVCADASGMDDFLFGESDADRFEVGSAEWIAVASQESAEFGAACAEKTGPLLGHVDTASTVQDLEMLRAIVGDTKLNYLGYSYGTYIGARYADAYPDTVGRLVLDGAIDPTVDEAEMVFEQTIGFENALRTYVTDCLSRRDCPVNGTIDEAMAQWGALLAQVEAEPLTGKDGRRFSSDTLLTAIITPLYAQQNWPYLDTLYETVLEGDPSTGFFLADFYYGRSSSGYSDNSTEAFMAINCLDYPSNTELDVEAMRVEAEELARIAPTIGKYQGFGGVFCASWPELSVEKRSAATAAGADPILVIGTTGDPATPYKWAVALADQLQSGVLVTYQGEGHTAYGSNDCIDQIVDEYFLTGKAPSADPMCKAGS